MDAWATFWATYPCHRHSTMASQAHEGLHQLWALPRLLSVAYFSWLFRHPVFLFTFLFLTQSARLPLVTYPSLCSAYVTYRMPYHASGHQKLPIQPLPRKAEDFPRGGNHSRHMPLLTCLGWLQSVYHNPNIYPCQYCKSFACGEDFDKKHRATATLISSHESIKQQLH